jgi:hypothetical protein
MLFGVQFAQEVNGTFHPLRTHDAVRVVKVVMAPVAPQAAPVQAAAIIEPATVVNEVPAATQVACCAMVRVPDLLLAPAPAIPKSFVPIDPAGIPEVAQPVRKPGRRARKSRPGKVHAQRSRSGAKRKSTGRKVVLRTGVVSSSAVRGRVVEKNGDGVVDRAVKQPVKESRSSGILLHGGTGGDMMMGRYTKGRKANPVLIGEGNTAEKYRRDGRRAEPRGCVGSQEATE